jgi:hypothetical protein
MSDGVEAMEIAAAEWDDHVAGCDECLTQGNDLCYEGSFLADEVSATRGAPRAPVTLAMLIPMISLRRRPAFPGVEA